MDLPEFPHAPVLPHPRNPGNLDVAPDHPVSPSPHFPTEDKLLQTQTWTRANAIAVLIVLGNFVTMISFGAGIGGGLIIAKSLGIREPSQASWIPASYALTSGAFVLMTGRLGAVYGHKRMLLLGAGWWTIWSFVNGFCNSFISFNVARALSGVGAAMIAPNAVAIVGMTLPPGKKRNLSLGLFGAAAPAGGWAGALLAGLLAQLTPWRWLFVVMTLLGILVFGSLAVVLCEDTPITEEEKMDWLGSALGIGALILFNFVWNQAPRAGWNMNYEAILLAAAVLLFFAFGIWEYKFAAQPILPMDIWVAPSFFPLIIVIMLSFMSYGTFIWYVAAWQQQIRHWSALSFAAGLTPLPICAASAAIIGAWLIPRLAAQWILVLGGLAVLISQVLIATMPEQQSYWAQVFPAIILQSFCPDFIFTAAQIIACNSVRRREQGIAGSLIGTLQFYATSIGLGFAGTVETHTNHHGASPVAGYRSALYFGMALASAAIILSAVFVRMPKDTREGWQGEDATVSSRDTEKSMRQV